MRNNKPIKTVKTIKEYRVKAFGFDMVIPAGSPVSNQTACGPDDNYRFLQNNRAIAKDLTGHDNSALLHDMTHYGINIPAEYCEPYANLEIMK